MFSFKKQYIQLNWTKMQKLGATLTCVILYIAQQMKTFEFDSKNSKPVKPYPWPTLNLKLQHWNIETLTIGNGNGYGLLFHMTQPTSRSIIKAIACSKPTISEH